MEAEDFIRLKDQEIAALGEQIDNLIARIRIHEEREAQAQKWKEDRDRLLLALDECLSRERARNEIRRQEQEALEL
jgi:hypothetical protein